jgi:hypothetical protein
MRRRTASRQERVRAPELAFSHRCHTHSLTMTTVFLCDTLEKLRRRLSLRRSKSLGPADQNALVARRVGAAVNVAQCMSSAPPPCPTPAKRLLFGVYVLCGVRAY